MNTTMKWITGGLTGLIILTLFVITAEFEVSPLHASASQTNKQDKLADDPYPGPPTPTPPPGSTATPVPTPRPTLVVPTEPPVSTLYTHVAPSAFNWFNQPVTITFSATNPAWLGTVFYRINHKSRISYFSYFGNRPGYVDQEGINIIKHWAQDLRGNTELLRETPIQIDYRKPTASIALVNPPFSREGWHNEPLQFRVNGDDVLSGIDHTEYQINSNGWQTFLQDTSLAATGIYTIAARALDKAGNIGEATPQIVRLDLASPSSTHFLTGTLSANNWYTSSVQVAFSGSDVGSGLAQISYRVDGNPNWSIYAAPFNVSADGQHIIEYRAMDVAGNQEIVKKVSFFIDTTPPTSAYPVITGTLNTSGWYTSPVAIELKAVDQDSSLQRIEYNLQNSGWQTYVEPINLIASGIYPFGFRAINQAGLVESTELLLFSVDLLSPQSASPVLTAQQLQNGWYNENLEVQFKGVDDLSGIDFYRVSLNESGWQSTNSRYTLNHTGEHSLYYQAIDQAGNASQTKSLQLNVDITPPVSTYTLTGELADSGWFRSSVEVSLASTDLGSGVSQTLYRVNQAPVWSLYAAPFTIEGDGAQSVEFYSTDRANNIEPIKSISLKIDTTAPKTAPPIVRGTRGSNDWYVSPVTIELLAQDSGSNIQRIEYQFQTPTFITYTSLLTLENSVSDTFTYRAVDFANNVELTQTIKIYIDLDLPDIKINPFPELTALNHDAIDLTDYFSATDSTSGLNSLTATLDGELVTSSLILPAGNSLLVITAVDNAGNERQLSKTITVQGSRSFLPFLIR